MESKHKNALIGALLAVVFVMAVGYAAFAQQLTINGTAQITSKWDIRYNTGSNTVTCKNGITNGTTCGSASDAVNPYGTITYTSDILATIDVKLVQPGDTVTFVLNPHNYGTGLNAHGQMTVASSSTAGYEIPAGGISTTSATGSEVTVVKDHIKFTITPQFAASLAPDAEDTITVKAEYLTNQTTNETVPQTKAGITVSLDYSQVS